MAIDSLFVQVMSKRPILISHLANTHGVIDKYMPKGLKSNAGNLAEKTKESRAAVNVVEEKPIGQAQQKRKSFVCKLCCATRFKYRELVVHYSLVHYKAGTKNSTESWL
jgi:hypothetical protein